MAKKILNNLDELRDFSASFLSEIRPKDEAAIIALHGDLGAGKTAFVKEAAKYFGIKEDITSPTFVLIKYYKLLSTHYKLFIHIDAYRLEKESELLKLGWEEMLKDPETIVFVEWPEKVAGLIPKDALTLRFAFIDEKTREVEY